MLFTIESLLVGSDLKRAQEIMQRARFVSGGATAADYAKSGVKNNLEMEVGEDYLKLVEILNAAVDSNNVVCNRVFPRYRINPIINRCNVGMYYKTHIDSPIQGAVTQLGRAPGRFGQNFMRTDYSMTVFLSEPIAYDGGELELDINGPRQRFKLPAGSAVCYTTGIDHAVLPVTRGYRIAAVYWFQSLIRDAHIRRTLWNQSELARELLARGEVELAEKANNVRQNFVRYLAEV